MGKKLDALLGRNFKTSKFKATMNLGISRLSVLKNQRQARCSIARSDVLQLLNLGQHERALLRVEQVIKEQNMLDVYAMIESYFYQLIERINLIETERTCPEELNEAVSSLIYAATRCGEFPELQEIRLVFTSRFGKEFAARAVELRNNCGVNLKMIQKLSTRMPSLDSRLKVLKEIASENNIILQIEELESETTEEQKGINSELHHPIRKTKSQPIGLEKVEGFSDTEEVRNKYKDVAAAAQAAFESAAFAAAAARAAVELSRSDSHDPDDPNSPMMQPKVMSTHDAEKLKTQTGEKGDLRGVEEQKVGMGSEKINRMQKFSPQSKEEEMPKAELEQGKNQGKFNRSSNSSSDSMDKIMTELSETDTKTFSHNELLRKLHEKEIVFDESDDESHDKSRTSLTRNRDLGSETKQTLQGSKILGSEIPYSMEGHGTKQRDRKPYSASHSESQANFKMEKAPEKFMTTGTGAKDIEKRPISVRTKRTFGR